MMGSPNSRQTPNANRSVAGRLSLIAALAIAFIACILSAADRAGLPILAQASCYLPTPRSCLATLALQQQQVGAASVLDQSGKLARANPSMPVAQAFHGLASAQAGQENSAATFLLNSARLGWREAAGQSFAYLTAVAENDAPRAILHLDTLLKLDPARIAQPQLMAPVWESADLRRELSARLAAGVPYHPQLLRSYGDDTTTAWTQRTDLLDEARVRGLDVDNVILQRVMTPLWRKEPFKALDVWIALKGPGDFASKRLAWDTDASSGSTLDAVAPFQWHDRANIGTMVDPIRNSAGTTFVATDRLTGRARDLVGVAVPITPGQYPVSWRVVGPSGSYFLSFSCAGSGRAELTDISEVSAGARSAILEVGENCAMPLLSIAKAQGEAPEGSGIGSIRIGGLVLLD